VSAALSGSQRLDLRKCLSIKRVDAKILQASTSEICGDPACTCKPKDYRRQHNMPIKVARIFNTYGPRMHSNDGRVVSNFIVQALLEKDITVYEEGLQTRSFC
jgi:UDP-glucuronate decarboxylase